MDLGFYKHLERRAVASGTKSLPKQPDLAFLFAVSAAWQAASPTARCVELALRGGVGRTDPVLTLARMLTPRRFEVAETAVLGGSFHPAVATRLTVGQEA